MHNATTTASIILATVTGYLLDNWSHCGVHSKAPALALNPAAAPLDLLAWCGAEITTPSTFAYGLGSTNGDSLRALVQYRLPAVRDVQEHAIGGLIAGGRP